MSAAGNSVRKTGGESARLLAGGDDRQTPPFGVEVMNNLICQTVPRVGSQDSRFSCQHLLDGMCCFLGRGRVLQLFFQLSPGEDSLLNAVFDVSDRVDNVIGRL